MTGIDGTAGKSGVISMHCNLMVEKYWRLESESCPLRRTKKERKLVIVADVVFVKAATIKRLVDENWTDTCVRYCP